MPYLVKSLTNIKEGAGAVVFCFKSSIDGVAEAMYLLDGRMFMSKSKLVIRYPLYIPVVGSNSIDK
jgi:hypothetical protein